MGEMMFAQSHDEWMGVLGKKRPQIQMMSEAPLFQFETWKKQKTTSVNEETEQVAGVCVEMRRAMRAAMLKARFADTISRATLELEGGSSCDVSSLQQQITAPLLLEKQHHTHKARNEAQIKAAEAASQRKAQYDLKKRREAEREAARMALQEMEKSVCVDESAASIMRDFEKLIGLPSGTGLGYPNTKPLQRLGLCTNTDNHLEQAEDEDVEEGEIVS